MPSFQVGNPILGIHQLASQLTILLTAFITFTSASPLPPNSSSSSPRRYKISNKYYSTTIHLRPLAIPSDVEGPEVFEEALDGVGGVAWVFGHTVSHNVTYNNVKELMIRGRTERYTTDTAFASSAGKCST